MMQLTRLTDMERKSFADMECSVAQCLEVVGEWWSMLIVRDVFLGVTRFDAFQQRLGISGTSSSNAWPAWSKRGYSGAIRIPNVHCATTTDSPTKVVTCGPF
jgi:hypothetical protein